MWSDYAHKRVLIDSQGTLGAGNHYAEVQVVEEIFDKPAAAKMGIDRHNQVPILLPLPSAFSLHRLLLTILHMSGGVRI